MIRLFLPQFRAPQSEEEMTKSKWDDVTILLFYWTAVLAAIALLVLSSGCSHAPRQTSQKVSSAPITTIPADRVIVTHSETRQIVHSVPVYKEVVETSPTKTVTVDGNGRPIKAAPLHTATSTAADTLDPH